VLTEKKQYKQPFPIQCQALPVLMKGRDTIGIAETGSGKTLAYILPLLRHIMDQPSLVEGDGPIALIIAPTRELAHQINAECKVFCKSLNLNSICVYGGAGIGG
jgi:ATP-dependent RNA helicase DDX46/PRP5